MTPGPAKQFDRDQALLRAMELFWSQGYEKTGMNQLLEHMGIGRQSLYDTFGSKRELFLECLGQYQQTILRPMLEIVESPGSPLGNLEKVFDYWKGMASEHGDKGCLLGRCTMSFDLSDEDVGSLLQRSFIRLEGAFRGLFERAVACGELKEGADCQRLAALAVHTAQGSALMGKLNQEPEVAADVLDTLFSLLPRA